MGTEQLRGAPRYWGSAWGGPRCSSSIPRRRHGARLLLFSQQTTPPPALVPARLPPLCLKINKKSADEGLLNKAEWHVQNVCPAWGDSALGSKDASLPGTGSRDPAVTVGLRRGRAVPRTTGPLGHARGRGSSWGASRTWAQPRDPHVWGLGRCCGVLCAAIPREIALFAVTRKPGDNMQGLWH